MIDSSGPQGAAYGADAGHFDNPRRQEWMIAADRSYMPLISRGHQLRIALVVGGYFALFAIFIGGRIGGPIMVRTVDDIGQGGAALLAAVTAGWQAHRSTGRTSLSWRFLSAGTLSWAIGQGIWTWYEVFSHRETPFPSLADLGYLIFPVLALIGVLVRPSVTATLRSRARLILDGLIVAASLFSVSWVTVFAQIFASAGESGFALAISLAYPVSDLVILTIGVLVAVQARARSGLLVLLVGLAVMAVADSSFSYLNAVGTYHTGSLVDFAWVGAFLLIALSAGARDAEDSAPASATASAAYLVLPYFLVLAGIIAASRTIIQGSRVALSVCALAIIALLIRQLLTLLDNRQLTLDVEQQREELRYRAFHDALTGLANRPLFSDRLAHALELHIRDLREVSVLFCDLDDFKIINDTLGHEAGDTVLIAVAERLRATVRTGDTVARFGGDEFAILLEDGGDALDLAGRLLAALAEPFVVGTRRVPVRASIGVTSVRPEDGRCDPAELLKRADIAMYRAKRGGKETCVLWSPTLTESDPDDLDLRLALAATIANNEIQVAFQPIVQLDGSACGYEALARWCRDGRLVPPDAFIPVAERTGLLNELDRQVIDKAIGVFVSQSLPTEVLSVNIGLTHLADPGLPSWLRSTMQRHGLHPGRLIVEVPEDRSIDSPRVWESLMALRRSGVSLALDDFGVGYSSLSRIGTLSPDIVKLDRSFISPLGESSRHTDFVAGIIDLSHRLGARVIAEGIETTAQLEALERIGCDLAQGFLLGRPHLDSLPRAAAGPLAGAESGR